MPGAREQSGAPNYKACFCILFPMFHSSLLEFWQQPGDLKNVGNLCSSASAMAAVVKIFDSVFSVPPLQRGRSCRLRGQFVWALGYPIICSLAHRMRLLTSALAWEPAATSNTLHYPPGYQIRTCCRPCAPFMNPARMSQRLNRVSDGTRCLWLTGGVFTIMVVDITLRPSWRRQIGGPRLWRLALFQVCFFLRNTGNIFDSIYSKHFEKG